MFNLSIHTDSCKIQDIADFWIEKVMQGTVDALELRLFATILDKISGAILADKTVLDMALAEATQRKGERTFKGHAFQVKEVGTKYDFSKSYAWLFAKGVCTEADNKCKEVETIAQTCKAPVEMLIDGVTLEVVPAIKSSTTSIVFSLNK